MMESVPTYAHAIAFYIAAGIAVFGALMVIINRHPVISAVYLVLSFFAVAAIYVILRAHFIAAAQVLVYAGAIAVLFVMVIMLMNLGPMHLRGARVTLVKALGVLGALSILLLFLLLFLGQAARLTGPAQTEWAAFGTTEAVARVLFTNYLLPFEIASILLLAAIVGAIVLARRWEE
jgi:NADH-quinone oxidoreductase subunit J